MLLAALKSIVGNCSNLEHAPQLLTILEFSPYTLAMARPMLDLQKVRDQFPPQIFERGEGYQASGEVLNLTLRGNIILAGVQGSDYEPYRVTMELYEDSFFDANCTCPYGENFGGYCKHIAAVALEYHYCPGNIVSEASVAEVLAPLDETALHKVLSYLLDLHPELINEVELYLQHKDT